MNTDSIGRREPSADGLANQLVRERDVRSGRNEAHTLAGLERLECLMLGAVGYREEFADCSRRAVRGRRGQQCSLGGQQRTRSLLDARSEVWQVLTGIVECQNGSLDCQGESTGERDERIDEGDVVVVDSAGSEEFDDVCMIEVTERELVGVAGKFVELRSAGLVEFIARPCRDDNEYVRRRFGACEESGEQQCGVVAEMEVVDDDHDRPAAVEFGEHGAEGRESVLGCIGGEEVVGFAVELGENLTPWPQGRAVVPTPHPDCWPVCGVECFSDKARLADAGRTPHELHDVGIRADAGGPAAKEVGLASTPDEGKRCAALHEVTLVSRRA